MNVSNFQYISLLFAIDRKKAPKSLRFKLSSFYVQWSVVSNCIESLKFFHFFTTKLFLCPVKQNIKLLFILWGIKNIQAYYIAY